MTRKFNHSLFDKAKSNKKDEFYTQLIDIEHELSNYKKYFYKKVVFCNCDDVKNSNFFTYLRGRAQVLSFSFRATRRKQKETRMKNLVATSNPTTPKEKTTMETRKQRKPKTFKI